MGVIAIPSDLGGSRGSPGAVLDVSSCGTCHHASAEHDCSGYLTICFDCPGMMCRDRRFKTWSMRSDN